MQKAASEEGVELMRQLTKAVWAAVWSHQAASHWEESFILNLYYKGKGEALDRGSHRALKLTDQVMKLLEWVLDFYIHGMVNIYEMQFGFVPGRGTDAIFIVRQQQKYIANNKQSYFAFVDPEKAFDHVPR